MYLHPSLALPLAAARVTDLHGTAAGRATGTPRRARRRLPRFGVLLIAHTARSAR
jgi:hypothetical protein